MSTSEQHTRPDVKEIKDAYDYLFNSSHSLTKIKDAALGGRLFRAKGDSPGVAGRSLAWKLFLVQGEPLQTPADVISVSPLEALRALRKEYVDLLLEKMRAPDGSYEDGLIVPGTGAQPPRVERSGQNLERNNPLSLDDENPWREWFASVELRKTISQDVERTFPDIGYFRDTEVQTQLTHILYVYSVMHPDVGYRQGMHELLAPLYYAIDYDSIDEASAPREDPAVKEFCARAWVAADAWGLFSAVMRGVGRWYEWQETRSAVERTPLPSHVQLSASGAGVKPYVAPIVEACNRIQSTYLKMVDPELWKSMQSAGIEPQIYGIRWLRLLFTREFDMHDSMLVWDGLFACDPSFDLAQWICVAMLLRIRNKLIPSDYSEQLTFLLRYPSNPLSSSTPDPPTIHHATLLLRQALTLQMSPSPATGVSVIHENRNLLDIPVEVPAPAPPPPRRVTRGGQRGQSFSNASGPSSPGLPGSSGGSAGRSSHSRQQSTPMGLPEFFANRLLEKGESLGINKTVMNAMSELKRNLPDIATSLGRLPLTPPQHTSYAAYPLVDERPPAERPPWEPRSRFEMEREVSDLRALQKRLGDSVGWIVDTLLLDDDAEGEIDRAKSIRNRKREAVECLAYVRDVLNGTVTDVEKDRLVGEEELARRKQAQEQQRKEAEEAARRQRAEPTLPQRAASPPAARPQGIAIPSNPLSPRQVTSRSPPRQLAMAPVSQSLDASRPPLFSSTLSSQKPNAHTTHNTPIAPWNYTRSDFSNRDSPITTLPRVPPRTSMSGPQRMPVPASAFTPPSVPEPPPLSRDQAPRRAQQDPLGVLP